MVVLLSLSCPACPIMVVLSWWYPFLLSVTVVPYFFSNLLVLYHERTPLEVLSCCPKLLSCTPFVNYLFYHGYTFHAVMSWLFCTPFMTYLSYHGCIVTLLTWPAALSWLFFTPYPYLFYHTVLVLFCYRGPILYLFSRPHCLDSILVWCCKLINCPALHELIILFSPLDIMFIWSPRALLLQMHHSTSE